MNDAGRHPLPAGHQAYLQWNIRTLMAERGMFKTTDLAGPLEERGVFISRSMIYNLVSGTPKRINTEVLAALCDILDCTPSDLLELRYTKTKQPLPESGSADIGDLRPVRATVRRPDDK